GFNYESKQNCSVVIYLLYGLSRAAEPLHHFNTSSVDHLIILAGDGGAGGTGGSGSDNGGDGGHINPMLPDHTIWQFL
ncbi:hypothetical protein J1785_01460, partial [Rahnella sp. SL6]|nr:hypothetical protein [Rahnella perminowiae]